MAGRQRTSTTHNQRNPKHPMNNTAPLTPKAIGIIEVLYHELGREHRRHAWENSDWIELSDCEIEAFAEQQAAEGRIPSERPIQWLWLNFLLPLRPRLTRELQSESWAIWWPRASMRTADLVAALDDCLETAEAHARLLSGPESAQAGPKLVQNYLRAVPLAAELQLRAEEIEVQDRRTQAHLDELRTAIGQQRNEAENSGQRADATEAVHTRV